MVVLCVRSVYYRARGLVLLLLTDVAIVVNLKRIHSQNRVDGAVNVDAGGRTGVCTKSYVGDRTG